MNTCARFFCYYVISIKISLKSQASQAWWCTPVIPVFGTLRQKDQHMFKTSLVYMPSRESIVKSCFRKIKGEEERKKEKEKERGEERGKVEGREGGER